VRWDPLSLGVRLTPTADIVVVHDIAGITTDCNEVAANLLGYPALEITGQPLTHIIPLRLRSDLQALTRRLLDSPQVTTVDTVLLARDGSEVPVRLPDQKHLDMLKIDRSFISGLPLDLASVALTTSIIGLAAAFGLVTVAEGVETTEQLDKLRELRCAQLQSYLYSRPVSTEQIELLPAARMQRCAASAAPNPARNAAASTVERCRPVNHDRR
jgi:PAS domain S-box-containing protein